MEIEVEERRKGKGVGYLQSPYYIVVSWRKGKVFVGWDWCGEEGEEGEGEGYAVFPGL